MGVRLFFIEPNLPFLDQNSNNKKPLLISAPSFSDRGYQRAPVLRVFGPNACGRPNNQPLPANLRAHPNDDGPTVVQTTCPTRSPQQPNNQPFKRRTPLRWSPQQSTRPNNQPLRISAPIQTRTYPTAVVQTTCPTRSPHSPWFLGSSSHYVVRLCCMM